jgi:hypothetical protein
MGVYFDRSTRPLLSSSLGPGRTDMQLEYVPLIQIQRDLLDATWGCPFSRVSAHHADQGSQQQPAA